MSEPKAVEIQLPPPSLGKIPKVTRVDRDTRGVAPPQRSGVLELRLRAVVARLAERLPVRRVPEERLAAFMRHDVIDDRCRRYPAELVAEDAERVRCQECLARLSPSTTVQTIALCLSRPQLRFLQFRHANVHIKTYLLIRRH